ncbi:MAG TPA: M3 family oligoendopeptidase [Anaerolineales bacterium]|nr:M3 family oligoendopeptidase [Anaerolineales bacterium]
METPTSLAHWSLTDLLPEPVDQSVEARLKILEGAVSELEAMRPSMTPEITEEDFGKILATLETINALLRQLEAYSYLWFAEDTHNQAALNLRDRLDRALVEMGNRILFFDLWFKELPDEAARRLIAGSGDMRYALESSRRFKPFTLSEVEERLINLKDVNGINALVNIYEMITNHFTFNLEVNGEKKSLSKDALTGYVFNASPELRAAAYQELYRVYSENSTILAQIYSHRVRDWHAEAVDLRHYASSISARNLDNDLPDEVVDILLEVCRKNAGIYQRYFRLKAGWLGLKKLRRYDIYAPLAESNKTYDFAQTKELVLGSYREFSPEMADLASRVFDENHLDAQARPGKRGGAFCLAALPGMTPWVLVNYSGRPRDVTQLAHELGHAIHAMLAAKHSVSTFHASLPLAETASVFGEMQLTQRLLQLEHNPTVRRDLLAHAVDDAYVNVLRQAYFTLFEREAHRLISAGASFEQVTQAYQANLVEQFGDSVELSDEFRWEWITVPHIYNSPFYTYAYSFGQLLVLALYRQYKLEGATFIPKYLKILAHGGSASPVSILEEAGINIKTAAFWQSGFDVLDEMIAELAQMA